MFPVFFAVIAALHAAAVPDLQIIADAGSTCPDSSSLAAQLTRPGSQHGAVPPSGWQLRYRERASGRQNERSVDIELVDGEQQPRLRRQLTVASGDCGTVGETIVSIVERYFDSVGWSSGAPLSTPPPPVGEVRASRTPTSAPPVAVIVGIGPAAWIAATPVAVGTVDLRVQPRAWRVRIGAAAFLPAVARSEDLGNGRSVSQRNWPFRISLTTFITRSSWELEAGPHLRLGLDRAQTTGITMPQSGRRLERAVGAVVGGAWRLGSHWRLAAELAVDRTLPAQRFYFEAMGQTQWVLDAPPWQAVAGLRAAYVFWP